MTEARVRECPLCKTRFYKIEGCNKMTCPPPCKWLICYICRKDITKIGYKHFCQAPHCSHKKCGKCVLFSDGVADDRLAMRDAGLKVWFCGCVNFAVFFCFLNGCNLLKAADLVAKEQPGSTKVDVNVLLDGGTGRPPSKRQRV